MSELQFPFPKSARLRSSAEFKAVFDAKSRTSDSRLLIFARANGSPRTRCGLSVSKKHGNAVARNRLKRLLREAFRLTQPELPTGLDVVLIPQRGAVSTLFELQDSLKKLLRKLSERHGTSTSSP